MNKHRQYFTEQIQNKRLSHAYLFAGDDQEAKEETMIWMAQSLVCPNSDQKGHPCQSCHLCQRIKAFQVPDIQVIESDGKQIKVDQIRQLRDWLNRSPLELTFKMVMIQAAEQMNDAAANALLTILEEPKSEVYLILNVDDTARVLPTIKSRTVVHQFQASSDQKVDLGISQTYQKIFSVLPSKTQGILRQLETDELEEFFEVGFDFYQLVYLLPPAAFSRIQSQFKPLYSSMPFDSVLDYLLWLNYQTLATLKGKANQNFSMIEALIDKQTHRIDELLTINESLLAAKQYLQANVSSQLVAEKILLENLAKRRG